MGPPARQEPGPGSPEPAVVAKTTPFANGALDSGDRLVLCGKLAMTPSNQGHAMQHGAMHDRGRAAAAAWMMAQEAAARAEAAAAMDAGGSMHGQASMAGRCDPDMGCAQSDVRVQHAAGAPSHHHNTQHWISQHAARGPAAPLNRAKSLPHPPAMTQPQSGSNAAQGAHSMAPFTHLPSGSGNLRGRFGRVGMSAASIDDLALVLHQRISEEAATPAEGEVSGGSNQQAAAAMPTNHSQHPDAAHDPQHSEPLEQGGTSSGEHRTRTLLPGLYAHQHSNRAVPSTSTSPGILTRTASPALALSPRPTSPAPYQVCSSQLYPHHDIEPGSSWGAASSPGPSPVPRCSQSTASTGLTSAQLADATRTAQTSQGQLAVHVGISGSGHLVLSHTRSRLMREAAAAGAEQGAWQAGSDTGPPSGRGASSTACHSPRATPARPSRSVADERSSGGSGRPAHRAPPHHHPHAQQQQQHHYHQQQGRAQQPPGIWARLLQALLPGCAGGGAQPRDAGSDTVAESLTSGLSAAAQVSRFHSDATRTEEDMQAAVTATGRRVASRTSGKPPLAPGAAAAAKGLSQGSRDSSMSGLGQGPTRFGPLPDHGGSWDSAAPSPNTSVHGVPIMPPQATAARMVTGLAATGHTASSRFASAGSASQLAAHVQPASGPTAATASIVFQGAGEQGAAAGAGARTPPRSSPANVGKALAYDMAMSDSLALATGLVAGSHNGSSSSTPKRATQDAAACSSSGRPSWSSNQLPGAASRAQSQTGGSALLISLRPSKLLGSARASFTSAGGPARGGAAGSAAASRRASVDAYGMHMHQHGLARSIPNSITFSRVTHGSNCSATSLDYSPGLAGSPADAHDMWSLAAGFGGHSLAGAQRASHLHPTGANITGAGTGVPVALPGDQELHDAYASHLKIGCDDAALEPGSGPISASGRSVTYTSNPRASLANGPLSAAAGYLMHKSSSYLRHLSSLGSRPGTPDLAMGGGPGSLSAVAAGEPTTPCRGSISALNPRSLGAGGSLSFANSAAGRVASASQANMGRSSMSGALISAVASSTRVHKMLYLHPQLPQGTVFSLRDFETLHVVNEGYAANVHQAYCGVTGDIVILKTYFLGRLDATARRHMHREVSILARCCEHPHIVRLWAAFQDEEHVVLVLEYCDAGDLLGILRKHGLRVSGRHAVGKVLVPLLGALQDLHAQGIVHRDLKPANICYTSAGELRLCDFGLAVDTRRERAHSRMGTRGYVAPEQLVAPPTGAKRPRSRRASTTAQLHALPKVGSEADLERAHISSISGAAAGGSGLLSGGLQWARSVSSALRTKLVKSPSGQYLDSSAHNGHQVSESQAADLLATGGSITGGAGSAAGGMVARAGSCTPLYSALGQPAASPVGDAPQHDGAAGMQGAATGSAAAPGSQSKGQVGFVVPPSPGRPLAPATPTPNSGSSSAGILVGPAADVWAVGIITYQMLCGSSPFPSDPELCRLLREGKPLPALTFPQHVPAPARDFIAACLARAPADRPSCAQLLQHPWVVSTQPAATDILASRASDCSTLG